MRTAPCPVNQKAATSRPIYRPRRPRQSPLYQLLEDHYEAFLLTYEERYQRQYGPLRPDIKQTVYQFLDCGILEHGFARVICPQCRLVRYSGVYANRSQRTRRAKAPSVEMGAITQTPIPTRWKRQWQYLLRRVFDVTLTCPTCGTEMKILAVITEKEPIHKILTHLKTKKIDPPCRTLRRQGGVRRTDQSISPNARYPGKTGQQSVDPAFVGEPVCPRPRKPTDNPSSSPMKMPQSTCQMRNPYQILS